MISRPLTNDDVPALEALLRKRPQHNAFHLSALREFGLSSPHEGSGGAWAAGVRHEGSANANGHGDLSGVAMALRGTGGIFRASEGDDDTLDTLAEIVLDAVMDGRLALLSGHASQLDPLLPLIRQAVNGRLDRCHFFTLLPNDLEMPPAAPGFNAPTIGTEADMERLIDFYQHGFYSLARLPSRAAWRNRLAEQLAFRTLYFIADDTGKVLSSALSSAEGSSAAMLGGVATLEEYRGHGLSTQCVGALCRHLFAAGISTVSLFFLKGNESAAAVYTRLGFHPAGDWLLVPVGLGMLYSGM